MPAIESVIAPRVPTQWLTTVKPNFRDFCLQWFCWFLLQILMCILYTPTMPSCHDLHDTPWYVLWSYCNPNDNMLTHVDTSHIIVFSIILPFLPLFCDVQSILSQVSWRSGSMSAKAGITVTGAAKAIQTWRPRELECCDDCWTTEKSPLSVKKQDWMIFNGFSTLVSHDAVHYVCQVVRHAMTRMTSTWMTHGRTI